MINVKDANGNWVAIQEADLIESFCSVGCNPILCGMTLEKIINFRHEYEIRGGPKIITKQTIRDAFNYVFTPDGLVSLCEDVVRSIEAEAKMAETCCVPGQASRLRRYTKKLAERIGFDPEDSS